MNRQGIHLYRWAGFFIASVITIVGVALGFYEGLKTQYIIFLGVATFFLTLWGWNYFSVHWIFKNNVDGSDPNHRQIDDEKEEGESLTFFGYLKRLAIRLKVVIIIVALLLFAFLILAITIDDFFKVRNMVSIVVFISFLVLATILNRTVTENKSAFIGTAVLVGLFIIGSIIVDGFFSLTNFRSMLVFASFLGLACVGQSLVVLLGGLDLSIPFIIGSANVGLLYLFVLGVPPWFAFALIVFIGFLLGVINGLLSFNLQGQALIVTLGTGFAIAGGTQILTSIGTSYSGNVFGQVPGWLSNLAAMNGTTFGMNFPPVIAIWALVSLLLIFGMRNTTYGRYLYALGGNRTSAARLIISEKKYWIVVYGISGAFSALTGALLLGWSGGGFIGVGDPYLFMTLAAVVIGGSSLLGGWGGYGFTIIGVLVLQILSSLLVGLGFRFEIQQFVFGLLIVPMVAIYARSPHIRSQI